MTNSDQTVRRFAAEDAPWVDDPEQSIAFGDVFGEERAQAMDVTFIRWSAGEIGPFPDPLPYEEVFVVTRGTFTVRAAGEEVTASAGEVLHLPHGTAGEYFSAEGAEVVAITSPPYRRALREAGRGETLDGLMDTER